MNQELNQIINENGHPVVGYWGPVTSTIDWCESNYAVTLYIAEFWNSISNLSFIVPPLIVCAKLWSSPKVDKIYLLSLIYMAFTGLGSIAFHSTLKYEMQLWDELSMVWSALFVLFLVIKILKPKESSSYIMPLIAYGLATNSIYLFIKIPIIFQVAYGIIHLSVVLLSYKLSKLYPVDTRLYWLTIILTNVAFALWNIDNHFCPQLEHLRNFLLPKVCGPFTQFHAIWHVFAGYGSFSLVLYCIQAQFYARQQTYHVVGDYLVGMTLERAEEGKSNELFISPSDHGMKFAITGKRHLASYIKASRKQD